MTWTPKNGVAEWHITYRCDLACVHCNRFCYLPPTTPDMTLDDGRDFIDQAKALDWQPHMRIIGGEPTLHPEFLQFVELAHEYKPGDVSVYSNAYSEDAQRKLEIVQTRGLAAVCEHTKKPNGSIRHPATDHCLAPCDYGAESREPCWVHAGNRHSKCGISVDAAGYAVCANGGAIDGVLQLGLRTKRLADLFDAEFAGCQTHELCKRCGFFWEQHITRHDDVQLIHGDRMSRTWHEAVRRIERYVACPK